MEELKKLTVKYNGKIVGYLAEIDDKIAFQYDDEWIKKRFFHFAFFFILIKWVSNVGLS